MIERDWLWIDSVCKYDVAHRHTRTRIELQARHARWRIARFVDQHHRAVEFEGSIGDGVNLDTALADDRCSATDRTIDHRSDDIDFKRSGFAGKNSADPQGTSRISVIVEEVRANCAGNAASVRANCDGGKAAATAYSRGAPDHLRWRWDPR